MDFRICNDINECKSLWNYFSPNERIFDIWDFRACFFDSREHEPHFIVAHANGNVQGLLPLVFSKREGKYIYFGGWFTAERNRIFLRDKTRIKDLIEQCPSDTFIEGIDPNEGSFYDFPEDEYTHFLDLVKFSHDFDKYLDSLDKKRQKNLKSDLRSLPEYMVHLNKLSDHKRLAELNVKRYEDESKFNEDSVNKGISSLIELASKQGILDMISVEVNGKVEAVDVCVFFKGRYYALIGSSNYQRIPNLGKLMTVLDIKSAMEKKAKSIEFGATADHWKRLWEFDKEMLLKFVK